MSFQNQVYKYTAEGVAGDFASINPVVSTATTYIAKGTVYVGRFVWEDSENEGCVKCTGSGKPLGFVVRDIAYTNYAFRTADGTLAVNEGDAVNVMVQGDFKCVVTANVTKGQKVFVSTTDGTIKGGSAGATVSGHVETDFAFASSADANGLAVITNWGATPVLDGNTTYTAGAGITISGGTISANLTAGTGISITNGDTGDKVIAKTE